MLLSSKFYENFLDHTDQRVIQTQETVIDSMSNENLQNLNADVMEVTAVLSINKHLREQIFLMPAVVT